jgi:hypothetical protein
MMAVTNIFLHLEPGYDLGLEDQNLDNHKGDIIGGLHRPNIPILFALVWLVCTHRIFAKLKVKNANQFITFPNWCANQIDIIRH